MPGGRCSGPASTKPLETVPTTGVQRPGLSARKGPWTVRVLWLHDFETGGSPVLLSWKLKQFIFRIEEPEIPQMRCQTYVCCWELLP